MPSRAWLPRYQARDATVGARAVWVCRTSEQSSATLSSHAPMAMRSLPCSSICACHDKNPTSSLPTQSLHPRTPQSFFSIYHHVTYVSLAITITLAFVTYSGDATLFLGSSQKFVNSVRPSFHSSFCGNFLSCFSQVTLKQFYDIVEDLSSTHRDAVREIRGGFRLMSKNGTSVTEVRPLCMRCHIDRA